MPQTFAGLLRTLGIALMAGTMVEMMSPSDVTEAVQQDE
jgi:predicted phage tail protein